MNTRKLLSSISTLAVVMTTAACMDSDTQISSNEFASETIYAQAKSYANSFEQYAMLSSQLVTNSVSWEAGQYAEAAGLIDISALGGDLGTSDAFVDSGYCITDPADPKEATHVTWFVSQADDQFIMKGLGNQSKATIMGQLSKSSGSMTLATYIGNGEYIGVDSVTPQQLPADCQFGEITINSPLLITKMDIPQVPEDIVTRTEYTTGACAPNQTGHKLFAATISFKSDGSYVTGGTEYEPGTPYPDISNTSVWTEIDDSCKDPVVTATMETVSATTNGVAFVGGALVGTAVVGEAVVNNIGQIECKKAAKFEIQTPAEDEDTGEDIVVDTAKTLTEEASKEEDGEFFSFRKNGRDYYGRKKHGKKHVWGFFEGGHKYKFKKDHHGHKKAYKMDWYSKKYVEDHREIKAFTTDIVEQENELREAAVTSGMVTPEDTIMTDSYSTCGNSELIVDVNTAGDVRVGLDRVEEHTTPCGGSPGTFTDNVNGYNGNVTHPIWDGEATYTREVFSHNATNIQNVSVSREFTEQWIGQTISCDRVEDLNITCNTSNPDLSSLSLTDDRGFNYRRTNRIRGWADPVANRPNDPRNPDWNFRAGASGCEWKEYDTWGCNKGSVGQISEGRRDRDYTVASLAGTPSVSGWTTRQNAVCRDEKTENVGCPAGQTGMRIEEHRRHYTSTTPGSGSWSAWSVVSVTDTCREENSGGGGDDGGGGTSCLLAGTKVLMADGSVKPIENVQIGEITAAGRVLQTYKRLYNNATEQSKLGLFMNNGGLFEHDGVYATGRHPLYLDGAWIEMGDNKYATPLEGTRETIVYNLLTEDHVIPVVGNSGELYAYSDDLNNIHDTAEKGRIKNANLFTNAKRIRA